MGNPVPPSEMKARISSYQYVLAAIERGLEGRPFQWGEGERRPYTAKAARMGMTLVTVTGAKTHGYRVKRGAQPVGHAYFGAPIKRYAALYVLECQCVPIVQTDKQSAQTLAVSARDSRGDSE